MILEVDNIPIMTEIKDYDELANMFSKKLGAVVQLSRLKKKAQTSYKKFELYI